MDKTKNFMEKESKDTRKQVSRHRIKSIQVEVPKNISIPSNSGDMVVVTKAKNLVKYVFQITANSPKKFRFTFVNRLQDTAMECISNLYYANSINLKNISEKNA